MDGASSMDQQPAGQQQQMPGGVAPVEQQPVPDGQVAAGQQQQAFIRSPLHPTPELQRLLEQQRGYVDEMFRQQHEVVKLQLARIKQQQLEFMQRQGHILRNIVAAVNEQVSSHSEAQKCAKMSHTVGNCSSEEVRFEQPESNSASSIDEGVNTGSDGDRRKFVPIVNNKSARVNLDTGSATKASTGTWPKVGCQPMSTSVAEAVAAQMLEVDGKFYYEMTVGGWTFVGLARATRKQLFGCDTTDGFGPSQAVMKVDSGCLSSFVDRELAADVVPGFRSAERRTTAKYRPLDEVLSQLKQDLFFSPVASPERSLIVREEGERLQGKYKSRRQYKHQQPGTTAVLEASQQLTEPKLAGPWRISGLLDDLEEPLAVHKNEAGRSITTIQMQVLVVCPKAYGSIPNRQGVGCASPSEAILERIRTKLEFEPPPSTTSSALASERTKRTRMFARHDSVYSKYTDSKRQWSTGVDYDRSNMVRDDRRQIEPHAAQPRSPADWDPGPGTVKIAVAAAGETGTFLGLGLWLSQQPLTNITITPAVRVVKERTCAIGTGAMLFFKVEGICSGSTRTSSIKAGGCWSQLQQWKVAPFPHATGLAVDSQACQATTVVTVH
ncbi:uncharacterized protein LOC120429672 [Culex pipiens pallens]|uniref:uncharacterized protein LOC120429672 n=1 Tax=Culex pipiens pallens TaxID=42434 RepID=UPI0022AAF526|nr:uncharacterized protein LOC120429672 [Culex pipiens pallens]